MTIAVNGRIGTRTEYFLTYISNVMDVLDRNDIKEEFWSKVKAGVR